MKSNLHTVRKDDREEVEDLHIRSVEDAAIEQEVTVDLDGIEGLAHEHENQEDMEWEKCEKQKWTAEAAQRGQPVK